MLSGENNGKDKTRKKIRKRKNNKLIKEKKEKEMRKDKKKKGLWVFVGAICNVQLRDESYA